MEKLLAIIVLFFSVLFYGVSVKFQAQYLSPIIILWYVQNKDWRWCSSFFVRILSALSITALFWGGLTTVNNVLVPDAQKSQSWQYVKLFDLAAISVKHKIDYIPEANKGSLFSMDKMASEFHPRYINPLIYSSPILVKRADKNSQDILWQKWAEVVLTHPVDYLVHRSHIMFHTLFGKPRYSSVYNALKEIFPQSPVLFKIASIFSSVFFFIATATISVSVLSCFYIFYALKVRKSRPEAVPLLYMMTIAFGMIGILFFFSMAGVSRYVIISTSLMNLCHLMGWRCFQAWKEGAPKNLTI